MDGKPTFADFDVGQVYNRREDLHARYGGQQQGGISTPANHPIVFLFTSESGAEFGYIDRFRPDGIYWYTGEGQKGDMEMVRGNRAIRDHRTDGKELHLFEACGRGAVRYVGQATYLSHHWEERPDVNGDMRPAIVFELAVETEVGVAARVAESDCYYDSDRKLANLSLHELRRLALEKASPAASEKERRSNVYRRSRAVRRYVLKRAAGKCEGCCQEAPFVTSTGHPYLEPHHVRRVADGGPDHPRWVVALCPNCHRRVHHGRDGESYNARLARRLSNIEGNTDD